MKILALTVMVAALPFSAAVSQPYDLEKSMLVLTGASSLEDLGEETLDIFSSYARHPVRINRASERSLVSSGLFSRYQAASVADYRKRNGDILSFQELMLVDGFDARTAYALSAFVSFDTDNPAGQVAGQGGGISGETMARTSVKSQSGSETWSHAFKLKVEKENSWSVAFTAKGGAWPPENVSGNLSCSGRGGWSVMVGDFNTRFGQGLVLWSGFSLSGAQSAASFARHPSGLSPAWTVSPSAVHRGAAAELDVGRFVMSGFWSLDRSSGANITYLARYGQLGLTASGHLFSTDWRWSSGKLDCFGEVSFDAGDDVVAAVAGMTYNPAYQLRFSALGRWYPEVYDGSRAGAFRSSTKTSDEKGVALAFDGKSFSLTADAAFHPSKGTSQHKAVIKYSPQLSDRLGLAFRYVSRFRPEDSSSWRNEARMEASLTLFQWFVLRGCADFCKCKDWSWLAFAEAGCKREGNKRRIQAYVRLTAFVIDNWDDRIYMYERDIPGTFSVPAYYGRGYSLSGVAGYKWKRSLSINARISSTEYPGMTEKKPGKTGLNIQLLWDF